MIVSIDINPKLFLSDKSHHFSYRVFSKIKSLLLFPFLKWSSIVSFPSNLLWLIPKVIKHYFIPIIQY